MAYAIIRYLWLVLKILSFPYPTVFNFFYKYFFNYHLLLMPYYAITTVCLINNVKKPLLALQHHLRTTSKRKVTRLSGGSLPEQSLSWFSRWKRRHQACVLLNVKVRAPASAWHYWSVPVTLRSCDFNLLFCLLFPYPQRSTANHGNELKSK